jgi:hypothetical protein
VGDYFRVDVGDHRPTSGNFGQLGTVTGVAGKVVSARSTISRAFNAFYFYGALMSA